MFGLPLQDSPVFVSDDAEHLPELSVVHVSWPPLESVTTTAAFLMGDPLRVRVSAADADQVVQTPLLLFVQVPVA
jgi:hypothetical protein